VLIAIAFFQFFVTIFKRELMMKGKAGRFFLTSIFVGIGPILLILYFILVQDMTVDGLFIGMLIPYVLLGSLAIILKSKQIFTRPKTSLMKRYLSFGSPLAFKTIAAKLIKGGDRIVIQTLLNSAAVGAYSFAYLITSALGMFLTKPFTSAVRPIIYKNEEKPKVLQKTVTNANQAILVSMSIVAIVFAFFIEYPLMMLVSNIEYLEYMPLVYLLSIAFVIQAAKTFTGTGIQLANKTMIIMWITMVAGATNIIFNLVLVSLYDVWGAAIATVLIHLLMLFANIHYSEKYHHLRYPRRRIMILIATYSAMMIGFYIFQGIIMDVVLKIALTLLYITLLWFFRILTKNNIMYAIRTIKKT
ncbi:MAG: polysaccharide biosynthesis C-terminal domain-containing protein, partial [Candidatus Woesearchaeota archaeon]